MSILTPAAPGRDDRLRNLVDVELFDGPDGRRVLISADTYPPDVNGAAYFTHRLAVGLAARGNDVHVMCPSDFGPASEEIRDGVTVHRVRSYPIPKHPEVRLVLPGAAKAAAYRILRQVDPEVVHIQGHFPVSRACLAAAERAGVPAVATNHFMPDNLTHHLPAPNRVRRWIATAAWKDAARVFARADHVTTPTPLAAETFAAGGFDGDIEPVSCGIDLSRFRPRTGAAAPLRTEFGLPDRTTVLYVGRLDEEKHIDELVRAMPALRRHVDAQLVIAGIGPQREALAALAADLGISAYVHMLGFVPDDELPRLYQAADVFGIAGVAELQSIVTLEAMSSGLPVVAADAVALPHLVRDGYNGYLFNPGDVEGLAKRLRAILVKPGEVAAMGRASREMAAVHDESFSLARFEQIYARLATPARSLA
ncbi:MAG: glycosyltransferase [Stackebrandtia sp.]